MRYSPSLAVHIFPLGLTPFFHGVNAKIDDVEARQIVSPCWSFRDALISSDLIESQSISSDISSTGDEISHILISSNPVESHKIPSIGWPHGDAIAGRSAEDRTWLRKHEHFRLFPVHLHPIPVL